MSRKLLTQAFDHPGAEHRSLLFWAWNEKLDVEEIRRQIRLMKENGVGGFFMHSREGLETEYMGKEWMDCIRAAVDEARLLGLQAWLYDEDRWPSGTAGGTLPARFGDDSRLKGATLEVITDGNTAYLQEPNVLAVYRAAVDGHTASEIIRIDPKSAPVLSREECILVLRLEVSGKSTWFNHETPPDNLNPRSVKRFLESTHDKYKAVLGGTLGTTVPGIFTDEASLADRHASFHPKRSWIPWTTGFEDYFFQKRGYCVFDTLPCLYFNHEKSPKIRHDYWHTVSQRFVEAYSKVIGAWCGENRIAYTGHFLQEDKLGLSARVNGSIMPHYVCQHVPGIDLLAEQTDEYMTVKQCASVANQFGKQEVLTETYGCTGWEFSFEGQKWIGDWQYVLGVTIRSPHLAFYSLKGCRKRDYPPSFNYNTTWWNQNKIVEDYFARLGAVLTQGKVVRDVLVLHPMSTAWARLGTSPYGNPVRGAERDIEAINRYGYTVNRFLKHLTGIHYDADLGDETILSEHARIEGRLFAVNQAVYKAVIIPACDTLFDSTREKLMGFMEAGGKVIALTPTPTMTEGAPSPFLAALFAHPNCMVRDSAGEAVCALEAVLPRRISITDELGLENIRVLCMLRKIEDIRVLFVVNNDREHPQEVKIRFEDFGAVEEWDLLTGKKIPRVLLRDSQGLYLPEILDRTGSKLYVIDTKAQPQVSPALHPPKRETGHVFPSTVPIERTLPNSLILDVCRYSLDNGPWSEPLYVWEMQRRVRDGLNMAPIEMNGQEQRYRWASISHPGDGHLVNIRFEFEVEEIPDKPLELVLEEASHFSASLNGIPVTSHPKGHFLDKAFSVLSLPLVITGKNTLELSCRYLNAMEIEDCYLIGAFHVDTERRIKKEIPRLSLGDWTLQGYFHYAGSMRYRYCYYHKPKEGIRVKLQIPAFLATCLRVDVNEDSYALPWHTEEPLDIHESLKPGENTLVIEVFSSPRNLLGPFHLASGKKRTTNDAAFRTRGREHTSNYNVQPYGLCQAPRLIMEENRL